MKCINKKIIVIPELTLCKQEQVEEFKKILEGSETQVNVKNKEPTMLHRTPILLTSNEVPWRMFDRESKAFNNRMFLHKNLRTSTVLQGVTKLPTTSFWPLLFTKIKNLLQEPAQATGVWPPNSQIEEEMNVECVEHWVKEIVSSDKKKDRTLTEMLESTDVKWELHTRTARYMESLVHDKTPEQQRTANKNKLLRYIKIALDNTAEDYYIQLNCQNSWPQKIEAQITTGQKGELTLLDYKTMNAEAFALSKMLDELKMNRKYNPNTQNTEMTKIRVIIESIFTELFDSHSREQKRQYDRRRQINRIQDYDNTQHFERLKRKRDDTDDEDIEQTQATKKPKQHTEEEDRKCYCGGPIYHPWAPTDQCCADVPPYEDWQTEIDKSSTPKPGTKKAPITINSTEDSSEIHPPKKSSKRKRIVTFDDEETIQQDDMLDAPKKPKKTKLPKLKIDQFVDSQAKECDSETENSLWSECNEDRLLEISATASTEANTSTEDHLDEAWTNHLSWLHEFIITYAENDKSEKESESQNTTWELQLITNLEQDESRLKKDFQRIHWNFAKWETIREWVKWKPLPYPAGQTANEKAKQQMLKDTFDKQEMDIIMKKYNREKLELSQNMYLKEALTTADIEEANISEDLFNSPKPTKKVYEVEQ